MRRPVAISGTGLRDALLWLIGCTCEPGRSEQQGGHESITRSFGFRLRLCTFIYAFSHQFVLIGTVHFVRLTKTLQIRPREMCRVREHLSVAASELCQNCVTVGRTTSTHYPAVSAQVDPCAFCRCKRGVPFGAAAGRQWRGRQCEEQRRVSAVSSARCWSAVVPGPGVSGTSIAAPVRQAFSYWADLPSRHSADTSTTWNHAAQNGSDKCDRVPWCCESAGQRDTKGHG